MSGSPRLSASRNCCARRKCDAISTEESGRVKVRGETPRWTRLAAMPAPARRRRKAAPTTKQFKREKRDVHGWVMLDKPVGMTSTHAVAWSNVCSPPSAPAMPARSIRSPPAACRSRSAKRPRPSPSSWTAASCTASPCAGARNATPTTPRAASSPQARSRPTPRPSALCCRLIPAPSRRCRRDIRPSRSRVSAPMTSPVTARRWNSRPAPVEIRRLELIETPNADHAVLEAECGKGTYVRSLARDIGRAVGLFRPCLRPAAGRGGPFAEETMISLEQLEALCHRAAAGEAKPRRRAHARRDRAGRHPGAGRQPGGCGKAPRGQAVLLRGRDAPNFRGTIYVTAAGQLVALAEVDRGEIVPKRVFNLAGLVGSAGPKRRDDRCR